MNPLKSPLFLALVILMMMAPLEGHAKEASLVLRVRVAMCEGQAVRPSSWVEEHLEAARQILGPHGIRLQAHQDTFRPTQCELVGRSARNGLAAHVDHGLPTVLVVQRVQDLDLSSYNLMGVHWRYSGKDSRHKGKRWIILTSRARPPVLAHELGHYLGLPHDPAGGNLMTPGPSDPLWRGKGPKPQAFAPLLTDAQIRKIKAAIYRLHTKKGL